MTIDTLQEYISQKSKTSGEEFLRLFHGRGGLHENLRHLTIDSIDTILSVALYFQEENEQELLQMLQDFTHNSKYTTLVIQRRYLSGSPSEVLIGKLHDNLSIAIL